ncbi:ATP-dependent helicase, putative [Theileria annulata]|uniref:RNA helicase n=1 Tax=Theileria annulata TaxID=5874 RepID=Q4UH89_THEAN|nr:ATP-dependent helicase, putative [Theileria annulata]CAI73550.1 ATP-dependent helicase, putative [Theileria annulata]|eukprot:XP_954227.1 ATP-dependent helicase, putative [Theileria annulata]
MDGIEELQSLSVISKVNEMLKNYLEIDQSELAEFIIYLAKKSKDLDEFNKLLNENDANMSFDFINQLYRIIITLDPPKQMDEWDNIIKSNNDETNFPALSLKNNPNRKELLLPSPTVELSEWAKELINKENPNIKLQNYKSNKDKDNRDRDKHRRSLSRDRDRDRSRYRERDRDHDRYKERDRGRDRHKRSRSRDRDRDRDRDRRSRSREINRSRDSSRDFEPDTVMEELEEENDILNNKKRYINDIERWENQQLLKSGILTNEEKFKLKSELELQEEIQPEVTINLNPPNFLKGQTIRSGIVLSPIKLVAKPEGSLQRTITTSLQIQNELKSIHHTHNTTHNTHSTHTTTHSTNTTHTHTTASTKRVYKNILEERKNLPIYKLREEIINEIIHNQILIVIGETGSGKTTQIPQYLYESKFHYYNHFLSLISPVTVTGPPDSNGTNGSTVVPGSSTNEGTVGPSTVTEGKGANSTATECTTTNTTNNTKDIEDIKGTNTKEVPFGVGGTGGCRVLDTVTEKKMIGITQPRRISCINIAKRVSDEMYCIIGNEVGYCIRFSDVTSDKTIIKYMTDGMLLREILHDPLLNNYITIMLDEAHERTIATDVLFSLLKETCMKRKDFRLIVTSATLESEKFSKYFFNSKIFKIPGRSFPVEIFHSKEQEFDYLETSLITILNIHLNEKPGDILLFLTGEEDIETGIKILEERLNKLKNMNIPKLLLFPVYSALPQDQQQQIFQPAPPGTRKCILATNIAEASITIDGILYVIDPGLCKIKSYNPKTGMESLIITPISQANARQRAGRAGRTAPGKCFRLYTEKTFHEEMLPTPIPEIQRVNLTNVVIILKSMGINDFLHFDFMDKYALRPCNEMLIDALDILYHLGALDDEGLLTHLGRKMAQFPIDPTLSKILLYSIEMDCYNEIITIISMLSVQNIFYRPSDKREKADQSRRKFFQSEGDHLTYLYIYNQWSNNQFSNYYCYNNFLQYRALIKVQDIKKQLISIIDKYKFMKKKMKIDNLNKTERIQKCICSGFFHHSAKRDEDSYRTLLDEQKVYIHPSSSLFQRYCLPTEENLFPLTRSIFDIYFFLPYFSNYFYYLINNCIRNPEYVLYHELILTSKEYMRDLTIIKSKWLLELAPTMFISSNNTFKHSSNKIIKLKLKY